MKAETTLLLLASDRVARADFDKSLWTIRSAARPVGGSVDDAVRAALSLGGRPAWTTWVLLADLWSQEVTLPAAQIAGLTDEQLRRALSFEAEPYSGIAVEESATGFQALGTGRFRVAQMERREMDVIRAAIATAGGRLAGIAPVEQVPADNVALEAWLKDQPGRIQAGPIIAPPAPLPSPHRFLVGGVIAFCSVLTLLGVIWFLHVHALAKAIVRNEEFAQVARELDAVRKSTEGLRAELGKLEQKKVQRDRLESRRGSLLALMKVLAQSCPDDVIVRSIETEGTSTLIVNGISREAGVVDELGIVLSRQLQGVGWMVQPRSKTGKNTLRNGGPWEFALALTHIESTQMAETNINRESGE